MNYCIMTLGKIKSHGALVSRYNHDYRLVEVHNAFPDKKHEDRYLVFHEKEKGEPMNFLEAWQERIDSIPLYMDKKMNHERQVRKDGVLALDIILAYTPEAKVDQDTWCEANIQWLEDTFNVAPDNKSNIIAATYHGDEASPHIHAIVIPIDPKGHLNASYFVNGRERMTSLQTSYALDMERFGLKRGVNHSSAQHRTTRQYNAGLEQAFQTIPKPGEHESAKEYYDRASAYLHDYVEIAYKEQQRKETRSMQKVDEYRNERLGALTEEKENLTSLKATLESDIQNLMSQRDHLKKEIENINNRIDEKHEQHRHLDREEISH